MSGERKNDASAVTQLCAHVFSDGSACGDSRESIIHHPTIDVMLGPRSRDVTHPFTSSAASVISSADVPSEQVATCHARGLTDGMLCCDIHDETFDPSQGEVCTGCYEASGQPITLGFAPGGCMINTRHEPHFCGYSACGDRGGPHEACGKELPCNIAAHNPIDERFDAEAELRKLWWLNHGCEIGALYSDDGEMQCGRCLAVDFKRDALIALARYVHTKKLKRLAEYMHPNAPLDQAKAGAALVESLANHPLIVTNRTHVSGAARIAGTRLPVHSILYALRNAGSIEVLCRDYYSQLTKEQATEALSFAAMFIELAARIEDGL